MPADSDDARSNVARTEFDAQCPEDLPSRGEGGRWLVKVVC
jgi:hypothetical protein